MKIKSGLFTKVKFEKKLYSDESVKDTISKLMQQNGFCRETDTNQELIEFFCTEKGYMWVDEPASSRGRGTARIFSVRAQVEEENGKTVVNIYSVYNKSEKPFRYFSIAIYVLIILGYIVSGFIFKLPMTVKTFLTMLLAGFFVFWIAFSTSKEKGAKIKDLDIMVNEIVKRVEAIKRWDD